MFTHFPSSNFLSGLLPLCKAAGAEAPFSRPPPRPLLSRCLNLSVTGSFSVPALPRPVYVPDPLAARPGLGDREPRPKRQHRPPAPHLHRTRFLGPPQPSATNWWGEGELKTAEMHSLPGLEPRSRIEVPGGPPPLRVSAGGAFPASVGFRRPLAFLGSWRHKPGLRPHLHEDFLPVSPRPLLF